MQIKFKKILSALLAFALALSLFTATASAAVNVPVNVAATAGVNGVTVTWTDNSDDEIGFYIFRDEGGSPPITRIGTVPANTTSFLDTTAVGGKTYTYYVAARITEGSYTFMSIGFVLTVPVGKPAAPTNLTANFDLIDFSGVILTWKDNANNEERFSVYRRVAGATGWTSVGTTPPNTTTFLDATVAAGTAYEYMVQAFLSPNYSDQSNVATVTTPPAAPTGLTATAGAGGITLNWTNNAPAATLFYVARKEGSGSFAGIYGGTANVTTWVDTTAQEGKTYTYLLWVYAPAGGGWYSASSNEATATMRPLAPSGLTATAGWGGIALNWTNHSVNAAYLQVQRQHEGSGFYLVADVPATATTYLDTTAEAGKAYTYRIMAVAGDGSGASSNQAAARMLMRGDANVDGKVTAADAAAILRTLVELQTLTEEGKLNAKVTFTSGAFSAADAAKILRWLVDLELIL
ncbi:MAG: hypothetical protein FWE69_02525 [Clostridiales bacterium]|nr:hypothetical protein [Clostridiales bacterium]